MNSVFKMMDFVFKMMNYAGIPRQPAAALEYFQGAAEQGMPEAEFNIGVMESRGEGVTGTVDQEAAHEHFERAADGGHIPAQVCNQE